jgi:two-component system chemotaxis response regulator CheB
MRIVRDFPPDLGAAVAIVLHMAAGANSALAPILSRSGGLPAVAPRDGDPIQPGYVYVPTPGHHLEVEDGHFRLGTGPRVNGSRPAIDMLFKTVAAAYGSRVVGVVVSGGLDDGSAGLAAIREAGGIAIVQDPDDALVDSMPKNAIERATPEYVLPAAEIGKLIVKMVRREAVESIPAGLGASNGEPNEAVGSHDHEGTVTGLTCPECGGSLWIKSEPGDMTFHCRIGHALSPDSLFEVQAENVEGSLWAGVRALEEQATLAAFMAGRAAKRGDDDAHQRYEGRRRVALEHADALRKLLLSAD